MNNGKANVPKRVLAQAIDLLAAFKNSRHAFSPLPPAPNFRTPTYWIAPPPWLLKLNSCSAFRRSSRCIGMGATIRDSNGKVGSFSREVGHLLALREGLMLAKFYGLPIAIAENSFSSFSFSVASPGSYLWDTHLIVNDIQALSSDVGCCKCQATSKKGNLLAFNLASIVFSSVRERLWLDPSPFPVVSVVQCFSFFSKKKILL